MPQLKAVQIEYSQIVELVNQLDSKQKASLVLSVFNIKGWKELVYAVGEHIAGEKRIAKLKEEELDRILHE